VAVNKLEVLMAAGACSKRVQRGEEVTGCAAMMMVPPASLQLLPHANSLRKL
jgi:hypothetical protein